MFARRQQSFEFKLYPNIKVSKDHKNLSNLCLMTFKMGCVCVFCISLNNCLQYALRCLM